MEANHPTSQVSDARSGRRVRIIALAVANSAAVTTLYWNQALIENIAGSLPASSSLSLVPTTTLAGYAVGAAFVAFAPFTRHPLATEIHLLILALALALSGAAPNSLTLAGASFFVGFGAAAAQRLLASAAEHAGSASAATTIGRVIGGALLSVLAVRLVGNEIGRAVGWRAVFLLYSAIICVAGIMVHCTGEKQSIITAPIERATMWRLWSTYPSLRRAAFQQAALLAAFNAAWMVALVQLPAWQRSTVVFGGCTAGLLAAMNTGRLIDRRTGHNLSLAGAAAVAVGASFLLPAAYSVGPGVLSLVLALAGMMLVDAGTQIALVSNQTRVQALEPAARARLAASLTIFGFLGGAAGAGLGHWLWRDFGWQAAVVLPSAAGCAAILCSLFKARRQSGILVNTAALHSRRVDYLHPELSLENAGVECAECLP